MMCVQIPGVLDRLLNYSTRMRLYHRSGYEPCQYPEIPGHTRTRWPLRLSNPCRIAVKVVGYGGHVLSPPSLQPSNPPPVCRCSLEIILLRFHLLLLSKSFKLMQIDKFSRFWTPNFTITFSWAGSSSFDGGLMWCIFDLHFVTLNPSPYLSPFPTSLHPFLQIWSPDCICLCLSEDFWEGSFRMWWLWIWNDVVHLWPSYFRLKPFSLGFFLAHIPFTRFWRPNCACR